MWHHAVATLVGLVVALPAPATSITVGDLATGQGLDTLWATHPGGLSTLTPRIEGGATLTHTLSLPGADPVVATTYGDRTFVLDRASEAVLVFGGDEEQGFTQQATVPVGRRPSALYVADFNGDEFPDIAVTNEGSDDVSIVLAGPIPAYLPERRIAVGSQPRALAAGDHDHVGGLDLVVANFGSGTVSVLLGDLKGGFAVGKTFAVGAGPTALLGDVDVNTDGIDDIVVADSLDGTVAVLRGTEGLPGLAKFVALPGGAASQPVALTYLYPPERFSGIDVFVAARGTGALLRLHVRSSGTFEPARTVRAIAQPVAVEVGSFAGDRYRDFAVADAFGGVTFIPTPGARLIAADLRAVSVAARDGTIVWSRRLGQNRYGLARSGGALPDPAARKDPRPRIGQSKRGAPVLTRVRCGRRRCTAVETTLSGARGRPVLVPVPAGCRLRDLARWRAAVAYVLVREPKHGCPHDAIGLWLRRGTDRPRRVSRYADALGDLRGDRITWHETLYGGSGWRLRYARLPGKPVTVVSGNLDCCLLAGGTIDGRYVYWDESPDTDRATLNRVPITAVGGNACEYLEPINGFPWSSFAIDRGNPVYVDSFGVFELGAEHARWHRC
ncbi:hypothetical protein OM076_12125 [Solirubrobacter ginsenosidimutans]|uniref:VCBS repeat-containing protein n=1 Tax=Solirubrobacter ginsenosidimutans TaxID=490573 RepID=A0A9X3MQG0_9ACTN|nr:hypothetical protein [Solirubrobacter ginsenosidimutans]MDA0161016.1 hypothetical protein [Solirubrobacter ginsenosidimutans]